MKYVSHELATNYKSTFLSAERDQEIIWRKLFFESRPYSDKLKRLLVINTPNCLDETQYQYQTQIDKLTINDLHRMKYIRTVPRFELGEFEETKSYILLEFDDFIPTSNPEYRDCTISFTIICNLDQWELDDYKLRPHQIAGYIDGILNETKLTGIGRLQFMGASQIVLNENLGGMILRYIATHGNDDEENRTPRPAVQDLGNPTPIIF